MSSRAGLIDEMRTKETISRSRLHSGQVIPAVFRPVKTIVQRESRHWYGPMNGHLPLRPDRDLLLWRGPDNISQRVLI